MIQAIYFQGKLDIAISPQIIYSINIFLWLSISNTNMYISTVVQVLGILLLVL